MSKAVTLLLALVAAVVVTVVIDLLIIGKPVKRCKKMEIVSQTLKGNLQQHTFAEFYASAMMSG
jgi:hypothetical protein